MKFLERYLPETSWGDDCFCIRFPKSFDEEDIAEYGPNSILFCCWWGGENWAEGAVDEREAWKYLEVVVEFYADEHSEQAKEVYAYFNKIKEKYV